MTEMLNQEGAVVARHHVCAHRCTISQEQPIRSDNVKAVM